MPQIRDDSFVSFVHGHGAKYSSTPGKTAAESRQRPLPAKTIELARALAAAQLAFQRAAGRKSGPE